MFGMGGSEIVVILIIALLFLGPDKLPEAAKKISKGIRDIKKQSRMLQQQIEDDDQIGGAIRDLKSALRGDEAPRPKKKQPRIEAAGENTAPKELDEADDPEIDDPATGEPASENTIAGPRDAVIAAATIAPGLKLSDVAGEADDVDDEDDGTDLAAMVKPAPGTVAKDN